MFSHVVAHVKDAEILTIYAVYQGALPVLDRTGTNRDQPNIEQNDGQGQPGKTQNVSKVRVFQIEPVALEIAEHFRNPHSFSIGAQRLLPRRE